MYSNVTMPTEVPQDGILEDLHGFIRSAVTVLESHGCLIIDSPLSDGPLKVDVDPPRFETLLALVNRVSAPVVHVDLTAWTEETSAVRFEDLAAEDPSDETTAEYEILMEAHKHVGRVHTVTFTVVVAGVVYAFTFMADWYEKTALPEEVIEARIDRHFKQLDEKECQCAENIPTLSSRQ